MNWKNTILTIETFLENRPDMNIHNETAIQSAIFQSAALLDSETNGLLGRVWEFNYLDPGFAPDSELKRNAWELGQIVEAMITQTQYTINMGNDLTQGGGSYSIGNINTSWSRPETRDTVAPGVYKLLQNGRVYKLQDYGIGVKIKNDCCEVKDKYDTECLSRAIGDSRYVKVQQDKNNAGQVAVIGSNGQVTFANPTDISFSNFNATRIKDWNTNDYVDIDKITNQLFRGQDLYGVHSGVERGEIYNLVAATFLPWNKDFPYRKNQIINFIDSNGMLKQYQALRDNINKRPDISPEDWKELSGYTVDINAIVERVIEALEPKIEEVVNKVIEKLPVLTQTVEYAGENIEFESETEFNDFVEKSGIDSSYYERVSSGGSNQASNEWLANQEVELNETYNGYQVYGYLWEEELEFSGMYKNGFVRLGANIQVIDAWGLYHFRHWATKTNQNGWNMNYLEYREIDPNINTLSNENFPNFTGYSFHSERENMTSFFYQIMKDHIESEPIKFSIFIKYIKRGEA